MVDVQPTPADMRVQWLSSGAVGLFVALLITHAVIIVARQPILDGVDELGLFNPVYMTLHYGRMTYPIYYQPTMMVVHPPVRYSVIAALMKAGVELKTAEGLMVCLLTIAGALVIATGRWDPGLKIALLFGIFAALVFVGHTNIRTFGLRPDTELAVAWFVGLMLLEDGRLREWEWKRLAAGSFLLTYSSGVHYFGVAGGLGLLVYLFLAGRGLRPRRLARAAISMIGGACALGIPYLVLFVIPHLRAILDISGQVQAQGGWLNPIVRHIAQYDDWRVVSTPWPHWTGRMLYGAMAPLLALRVVPLFLVGVLALAWHRDTRAVGIAAIPLCVFIWLGVQGKSPGYFLPELLMFFAGVGVIVVGACRQAARWLPVAASRQVATVTASMAMAIAVVAADDAPRLLAGGAASAHEMDVARAAAQEMIGRRASVAGRLPLWYVSGASVWTNIEADLLWSKDISHIDVGRYLNAFDYVVEHGHMSYSTVNNRLESIPSWYANGILKLSGFYLSTNHEYINFLLFRTSNEPLGRGFVSERGRLMRFDPRGDGSQVFVSMICGFEEWPAANRFGLQYFNTFLLPKADAANPASSLTIAARPGNPQQAIAIGLVPSDQFRGNTAPFGEGCRVLDATAGELTPVDGRALVQQLRTHDTAITFFQHQSDFVEARTAKIPMPGSAVHLDAFAVASPGGVVERGAMPKISTPPRVGSFAASVPLVIPTGGGSTGWLSVQLKVLKGTVGVGVLDTKRKVYQSRKYVEASADFATVYLPVASFEHADALIVEGGANGVASEALVKDVRVLVPDNGSGKR